MKHTLLSTLILLALPGAYLSAQLPEVNYLEDFSSGFTYDETIIGVKGWATNFPATSDDYLAISNAGDTYMQYRAGLTSNKSAIGPVLNVPMTSGLSYEISARIRNTQFGETGDPRGRILMTFEGSAGVSLGAIVWNVGNSAQTFVSFGAGDGNVGGNIPVTVQDLSENLQPNAWYTISMVYEPATKNISFHMKDANDAIIASDSGTVTGTAADIATIQRFRFVSSSFGTEESDYHITDISITTIPEPATAVIISSMLVLALAMLRKRQRGSAASQN